MSMTALRSGQLFAGSGPATAAAVGHLGLRWDRFNPSQDDGHGKEQFQEERKEFFRSFETRPDLSAYGEIFKHWKGLLESRGCTLKTWRTIGRLCFGAGDKGVLEAGIRFHRTYGVPVIPGSAQKGLVRWMARRIWPDVRNADATAVGFAPEVVDLLGSGGDEGQASAVTFHDALWNPDSDDGPFVVDTITVHHPEYYRGEALPADWDSPTPLGTLSARGEFLFAVEGHPTATAVAMRLLATALRDEGIGARTLKGYGRFSVGDDGLPVEWQRRTLFQEDAWVAPGGAAARPPHIAVQHWAEGAVITYQPNTGRFEVKLVHEGKEKKISTVPAPKDLMAGDDEGVRLAALEALRTRCRKKGMVRARVKYEITGAQITIRSIEPDRN